MPFNPLTSTTGIGTTGSTATGSIQSAIAFASQKTGVDFHYLMGQAQLESGMRANAHSGASSASGLYQFIEQSWLKVVKQHGAEHGLDWAANAISTNGSGRMTVSDPATRRAILDLRNDPQTASLMAAEHASDNKAAIESALGRDATSTDLYMAHFLGLGGARSFLKTMAQNPGATGAAMFPTAAHANRSVFYTSSGQPRSLAQIYARFTDKLGQGDIAIPPLQLAATKLGDGADVIPGASETSTADAASWARATIDRLNGGGRTQTASLLRPTPNTARLAYMMLASLGG
jgi:hypothetical protein